MRKKGSSLRVRIAVLGLIGLTMLGGSAAEAVSIGLGAAGVYATAQTGTGGASTMTALNGAPSRINGDVFERNKITVGGTINGTLYKAPGATSSITGSGVITGGTVTLSAAASNQIVSDLAATVTSVAGLVTTQSFGNLSNNTTILGNGGLNVINIKSINLKDSKSITFSGGPNDVFVVRVAGSVTVSGQAKISAGSVGPDKVLLTAGGNITQSGQSTTDGTYIALTKDISLSGNGIHNGAFLVSGNNHKLSVSGNAVVNFVAFVPEPGAVALVALGLGGLGVFGRRRPTV